MDSLGKADGCFSFGQAGQCQRPANDPKPNSQQLPANTILVKTSGLDRG